MGVVLAAASRLRRQLAAYAALVRVPNLFTAPPDVLLGAALAVASGASAPPAAVGAVAVASVLLYAGGTTLNDYFDAPVDAEERPERPIPSGRVARRSALLLGGAFLAGGVVVAGLATVRAGVVAAVLASVVLLYDGVLGGGPAGFLAMGAARGLDVLLGAAAVVALAALAAWAVAVAAVVAGYVAAVTYVAADEATGVDRRRVVAAAAAAALAALAVPAALAAAGATPVRLGVGTAVAGGFVLWVGRPLSAAYADPSPDVVGPAVGACVLGLVVLDAAFAAVAGVGWTLLVLGFLVPAAGLSRAFDVS